MSRILGHVGYGRVRRPKNILGSGADGTTINAATNNPLDSGATLSDDVTQAVTGASLSGVTLTLTVGGTTGIAVGDQVQLQNAAPVMTNRPFSVTAIDAGNSVSIKLDLDAAQVVRTAAASGAVGATLRRRTTDGYRTENAKFLHLFMDAASAGGTAEFTVHAYNYAFGRWEKLQLPLAIDKGDAAIIDPDDDAGHGAEATAVAAGTVSDVYSDVTFSVANNTKRMVTIPIEGVDRVAFSTNLSNKSNVTLGAAISTI